MRADVRDNTGATARALAMKYGHTKIVGLIDLHAAPVPKVLRRGQGNKCLTLLILRWNLK